MRYKFEDTYSSMQRRYGCEECCRATKCPRKRSRIVCSDGVFKYKHPNITKESAYHILQLIKRDIVISKLVAEGIKIEHQKNDSMPETLKDFGDDKPSFTEAIVFIDILTAYGNYLINSLKEIESQEYKDKNNSREKQIEMFVNAIINTAIQITGTSIQVYSEDGDVQDNIKKECLSKNYIYKNVTKEEAESWWAPIMSGN